MYRLPFLARLRAHEPTGILPGQDKAPMSEYEILKWSVEPVEGDNQVALVIDSSDGNRWEYGIPYAEASGRFIFEEKDVIATDFGEEIAEEIQERLEEVIEKLCE
ncbi:MAG: hypothetical protein ACI9F9_000366 [Candidatus Paceibacteria bacterium]|jgi:hypothetical protein